MPLIKLTDVQAIEPPANSWLWTANISIPNVSPIAQVYIQEINLPFEAFDVKLRYRGGKHIHFPGVRNISNVTMLFYETNAFDILQQLRQWQAKIVDDSDSVSNIIGATTDGTFLGDNFQPPKNYLGSIEATLYNDKGTAALTVNIGGVWPAAILDYSLNYSHSGNLMTGCNFAVNYIRLNWAGLASETVTSLNQPISNANNSSSTTNSTTTDSTTPGDYANRQAAIDDQNNWSKIPAVATGAPPDAPVSTSEPQPLATP